MTAPANRPAPDTTAVGGRYWLGPPLAAARGLLRYGATDLETGTECVIEWGTPPHRRGDDPRLRAAPTNGAPPEPNENLQRRVERVRGVLHSQLIAVRDLVVDRGTAGVVTDLVEGRTLAQHLETEGRLPADRVARLAGEIAGALAALHRGGVLHHRVTPDAVVLDASGRAYLGGLAWAALTADDHGTNAADLVYTAPEIAGGIIPDGRADVFSLGVTVFQALAGSPPIATPDANGFRLGTLAPDTPGWLADLIARATRANPTDRPATAGLFQRLLADAHRGFPLLREQPGRPVGGGPTSCLVCAAGTLPGSPLCPECHPVAEQRHRFVVVQRPGPRFYRVMAELIAVGPGLEERASLTDAARGRRMLIRVPIDSAPSLAQWLADRGVEARVSGPGSAWRMMPAPYYGILAVGFILGMAAGLTTEPVFLAATPVVTALLAHAALREVRRPALGRHPRAGAADLRSDRMVAALRALRPGTARDLLADVARLARHAVRAETGPRARARRAADLVPLADAAAAVARELDRVDAELTGAPNGDAEPTSAPALSDPALEEVRHRLVQALLEQIAGLSVLAFAPPGLTWPGTPDLPAQTRQLTDLLERERRGVVASAYPLTEPA